MKKLILVLLLISSFLILNNSMIHAEIYTSSVYPSYFTGFPVPYGRIWDDQFFKSWSFQWPRSYQSAYQPSPLAYNPSYGLSSSYYPLISSYRPYSYSGSAFLPLPNIPAISSFASYPSYYSYSSPYNRYPYMGAAIPYPYSPSMGIRDEFNKKSRSDEVKRLIQSYRNGKIPFMQVFEYLTLYLEDSRNSAEAGIASTASVLRIVFYEMPEVQGLIGLGEGVIDPLIDRIADDNLKNKQLSMPAYAYVIEILDAEEAIPVFIQLAEEWKSIQDPFFITYFLVRTLDMLTSDEDTETSYKDYMESEFIESVIEKAKDYLENGQ